MVRCSMSNYHTSFESIIGQSRAKEMLTSSARSGARKGEMLSVLFRGLRGSGKTRIVNSYVSALRKERPDMKLLHYKSPAEIRLATDSGYIELIDTLSSDDPYILVIDECHELVTDNTRQHQIIFTFLRNVLDGNNKNKSVQISEELTVNFDKTKHVVILSSNFEHLLDSSGALQSRFTVVELDQYDEDELKSITYGMAKGNGITFHEDETSQPATRIARCGRGTARFLERIFEQLTLINDGSAITESQVINCLKLLKMYPRGLSANEVRLIEECKTAKGLKTTLRSVQFKAMTGIDGRELNESIAYLTSPKLRFISVGGNGSLSITNRGETYLKVINELGF